MVELGTVSEAYREDSEERSLASILQTDHGNIHLRGPMHRGFGSAVCHGQDRGYTPPLSCLEELEEPMNSDKDSPKQPQQPVIHPLYETRHGGSISGAVVL